MGQGTSSELATFSLRDNRVTKLGVHGSRPTYIDGGIVTYLSDGTLWGVQVDESTMKIAGEPQVIVGTSGGARVSSYAAARNGALVVARGSDATTLNLVVVDRTGKARSLLNEQRVFRWPRYSPDGKRIAVTVQTGANTGDLYIVRTDAGQTLERITSDSVSLESEWDPDGRSLVFSQRSRTGEPRRLERIAADGSGKPALLLTRPSSMYEAAITPDHKTLIWREDAPLTARDILSAPLDSPSVVHPIRNSAFDERGFSLAPDGKWLAFTSNEAGTSEIYICRMEANGAHWRVSRNGGSEPRWARTGELFYRNGDSVLVSRIGLAAEPTIGAPSLVFTGQYVSAPFEPLWDVSPDARQFVMVREPQGAGGTQLVLMVNWLDAWRARRGGK
jgi:serine/threonine-protein kinase